MPYKLLEYRSISDMNTLILKNLHKLPHDLDLIVGVPRSGMLPANLIALYLNKPFTDIDSFVEGKIYASGERGKDLNSLNIHRVLIMDDSISSGNAMSKALSKVDSVRDKYNIMTGVVFATTNSAEKVNFYCEKIDSSRIFQWNIFHHNILQKSCVDIDGVLCVDPPVDDDGPIYRKYIMNAPALYTPTVTIDTLVSCRLEKYRKETEQWLKNNNIKYNKLILLDFPSKAERVKWGKHGEYKGKMMKDSGNLLFIESSLSQAKVINQISGVPVFCTETFELVDRKLNEKRAIFSLRKRFVSMAKFIFGNQYIAIKKILYPKGGVNNCILTTYSLNMPVGHANSNEYARA